MYLLSDYLNVIDDVTMRNKLTVVVGIRFDEETHKLVSKVSHAQGIDLSDFIRRSVRRELARLSFLPADEKKALEVFDQ
jgi:tRNA U54 and U55 pseudouridine synthase Pus10